MEERIDEIRQRLESIGDELGELTLDLLRTAVAEGQGQRPKAEKPLGQARRAVEKATRLLDGIDTEPT